MQLIRSVAKHFLKAVIPGVHFAPPFLQELPILFLPVGRPPVIYCLVVPVPASADLELVAH